MRAPRARVEEHPQAPRLEHGPAREQGDHEGRGRGRDRGGAGRCYAEELADGLAQDGGAERLVDEEVGAVARGRLAVLGELLGREDDDLDVLRARRLADVAAGGQAVDARHHDVEDDQARTGVLDDLDHAGAAREVGRTQAPRAQDLADQLSHFGIVVKDEGIDHGQSLPAWDAPVKASTAISMFMGFRARISIGGRLEDSVRTELCLLVHDDSRRREL